MFGDPKDEEKGGIVIRACRQVLAHAEKVKAEGIACTVKGSMIEIYNEQINDLQNKDGQNLPLRETPETGVYIPNLCETVINNVGDLMRMVNLGFASRATTATKMNSQSSRSHCLVQVRLEQVKDGGAFSRTSKLNLIDLAGSEKVKKTGAAGAALKEAQNINKSLSALGKIIRLLSDSQSEKHAESKGKDSGKSSQNRRRQRPNTKKKSEQHIPYRDSKLTRLLQDSLGGNTKTLLCVACSPHDDNYDETISTLRFANRARMIQNITSVNARPQGGSLDGFKATGTTTSELVEQLKGLDTADKELEQAFKESDDPDFDALSYSAKQKLKEMRSVVEMAVGCAFSEKLFKGSQSGKGGSAAGSGTPLSKSRRSQGQRRRAARRKQTRRPR